MESLIEAIQSLYNDGSRGLGASVALDELLLKEGWTNGRTEMSWSGHFYRTRSHQALGTLCIECDSIRNRVDIETIDCDGFAHSWKTISPTPEQQVAIDSEIKAIMVNFEAEEYDYDESEFEIA